MRILVCGSRDWQDKDLIENTLRKYHDGNLSIVTGDARGADWEASEFAKRQGIDVKVYHAHWKKFGKFAGPERNTRMLLEGKPDLVIAFHTNITQSRGTLNMVGQANEAGIPIQIYGVKK